MTKTKYIKAISQHDSFYDPINKMLGEKGEEWTEELALKLIDGKIVDVMDIIFIQDLEEGNGNLPTENESQISSVKYPYLGYAKEEIKEIIELNDFSCYNVVLQEMSENEWNYLANIRKEELECAKNWRDNDIIGAEEPITLQDIKRHRAEKKFGVQQDVTEAKKRVMYRLKEKHPNMTEETIKATAKTRHVKNNINISKLISRDRTD